MTCFSYGYEAVLVYILGVFCLAKKADSTLLLRAAGWARAIGRRFRLSNDLNGITGLVPSDESLHTTPSDCVTALEAGPLEGPPPAGPPLVRIVSSESNKWKTLEVLPEVSGSLVLKKAFALPFKVDLVSEAKCQERVFDVALPVG